MDLQTINVIAAAAVGLLSSYLAKAGEAIVVKAGTDIYQTIKARFSKKSVANEILTDLEKAPEDIDRQGALRVQLQKILAEDEAFAVQLQRLLQDAGDTEAGATIIQQVAGDNAKQFGQVFGNITFGQE